MGSPDLFGGLPEITRNDMTIAKASVSRSVRDIISCPYCGANSEFYQGNSCKICSFTLDDSRFNSIFSNDENDIELSCDSAKYSKEGTVKAQIILIPTRTGNKQQSISKVMYEIRYSLELIDNRRTGDSDDIHIKTINLIYPELEEQGDIILLGKIKEREDNIRDAIKKAFYGEE